MLEHTFCQADFGAKQLKPTTLLAVRLPHLGDCLRKRYVPRDIQITLAGRHADGSFRTNQAKEYPPLMCAGIADAIVGFVTSRSSSPCDAAPELRDDLVASLEAFFVPYDPYLDVAVGRDYAPHNRSRGA